jgi:hypothetical protein
MQFFNFSFLKTNNVDKDGISKKNHLQLKTSVRDVPDFYPVLPDIPTGFQLSGIRSEQDITIRVEALIVIVATESS